MLSILNNSTAFKARNNLNVANRGIAKSIERLSSGLRINTAADDPSGLAVSERLRSQIKGLNRAASNAQNAASYMQTAESALDETHSILQRMRELAIEASDSTLTSTDRQTIQSEIAQLSEEVDRIATSTEFNTKKLLNGDATALWSSGSDKISAIIRGKVAEGNYEIEIDQEPVENHVLKTDIFSVKEDLQSVDNVDLSGTKASIADTDTAGGEAIDITLAFDDGVERTITDTSAGLQSVIDAINDDEVASRYVEAYFDSAGGVIIEALNEGEYANPFSIRSNVLDDGSTYLFSDTGGGVGTATFTFGDSAYYFNKDVGETSESGIANIENPDHMISGFEGTATYTISVDTSNTFDGTNTGEKSALFAQGVTDGFSAASTIDNLSIVSDTSQDILVQEGGANLMVEAVETKGFADSTDSGTFKLRFSFDDGENWTVQTFTKDTAGSGGGGFSDSGSGIQLTDGINSVNIWHNSDLQLNTGDKILITLTDNESASSGTNADDITVTTEISDGYGNSVQNSRIYRFVNEELDESDTELSVVQLDVQDGDWNIGTITVDFDNNDVSSGEVKFDIESGGIAGKDTELWKIDRFYDNDDNFILGDNGKTISIYNERGEKADFFIDAQHTIGEVAEKINDAIKDDLDMGTSVENVDKNIAVYVNEAVPGTDESLQGSIVVRSPEMSKSGRLYFSAHEDVLNALSIVTANDDEMPPSSSEIKVTDLTDGNLLATVTSGSHIFKNIISGVDIEIEPDTDISVVWSGTDRKFVFSSAKELVKEQLHISDNSKYFHVGANRNQSISGHIADMSAHALGVDNILVTDQSVSQKAIDQIDDALDRVSRERGRIGSVINRLGYTINNLRVQEENTMAAESQIRDVDVARETMKLIRNQVLSESAQTMLTQASQMTVNLLGIIKSE
ncbi:MAG: flagellin [bacterium]